MLRLQHITVHQSQYDTLSLQNLLTQLSWH